jgi:hypothetical protein
VSSHDLMKVKEREVAAPRVWTLSWYEKWPSRKAGRPNH